jgi:hypothetical protein
MVHSKFFRLLCAVAAALTITACEKNSESGGSENENQDKGPFIYLLTYAGIMVNGTVKYNLPAYRYSLDGRDYIDFPNAMYVTGRDVYVVSYMEPNYAVLKNGESQYYLFESDGSVPDLRYSAVKLQIFVYENDVYVIAGDNGSYQYLWKNGELQMKLESFTYSGTTLSGVKAGNIKTSFQSLFVSDGVVYIGGVQEWSITNSSKTRTDDYKAVVLWSNGVPEILETFSGYTVYFEESRDAYEPNGVKVFVEDNNICVAATLGENFLLGRIVYWLNGEKHICYTNGGTSYAYDMCMKDGDVYIAGYNQDYYDVACLWKNGTLTSYSNGYAYQVCVYNGDVYVAAYKSLGLYKSIYVLWKNGVEELELPSEISGGIFDMYIGD